MSGGERMVVLCVDDEPEFARMLARMLERENERFDTHTARTVVDAEELLESEPIDCVVSDYDMAERTGIDLLESVRARDEDLPFILYTGEGGEGVASEAISAGVTDYVRKNGDRDEYPVLANRIANAVSQYRAQRAATRAEQRYRGLIEQSNDLITVLDGEGVCQYQSPASTAVVGYEPDELIGEPLLEYVHPADTDSVTETFGAALSDPTKTPTVEFRFEHADGSWRWLESVGNNQLDNPAIGGFVVNSRDITERRERERAIEELERVSRAFTRADTPEAVAETAVGVVGDALGLAVGAVLLADGEELQPVARTDETDPVLDELTGSDAPTWDAYESREVRTIESIESHQSDDRVANVTLLPLDDHGVMVVGTTAASFDTTDQSLVETLATRTATALDRIEREQRLRRQKSRIEALHEVAADIEACDTRQAVYERTMAAAEEILAFDIAIVDEARGDVLVPTAVSSDLSAEEYYEETPIDAEDNFGARAYRTGESILVDDLCVYDVSPADAAFRSALTVPIGDHGIFQTVDRDPGAFDAADLESVELLIAHAEARLTSIDNREALADRTAELERQNERLEEFVGVVSHDLRSPLNVAQGRLELARGETDDDEHLGDAADAVDRSLTLIDDLLTLARQGERIDEPEPVALAAAVRECWNGLATADASLVVETDQTIEADPGRLRQLLDNLVRNAIDHGGPAVTVTVGTLADADGFYVADDGPGFPEDEPISDPGYSTADDGTGFGLSIVTEIADAHGWSVTITDATDGGARVEIAGVTILDSDD